MERQKRKREEINYEKIMDISKVQKLTVTESARKYVMNLNICSSWTMMDCVLQNIAHCLGD